MENGRPQPSNLRSPRLASAAGSPDGAFLSKHSNQNEKPDLGQESDAHDRDRKEHVARRERVHECHASCEAPGVNHSNWKMFRFQTQTARDASGAGIRGVLRRSPTWVKLRSLDVQPADRLYPQLRTWLCNAITDAVCQRRKSLLDDSTRGMTTGI
jgi:hypothetical protein